MGLRQVSRTQEERAALQKRFGIAQDSTPSEEQLDLQRDFRECVAVAAEILDNEIADGREKSVALTKLEEVLMWAGKAIFS